jgi:hypothetical protein
VLDPKTVRNVMKRHRLPPSPQRSASSWRTFLNHYKQQMLACDFLTVETVWVQTLYVLFFIELGTRQVYLAHHRPSHFGLGNPASQTAHPATADRRSGAEPLPFLIGGLQHTFFISRCFQPPQLLIGGRVLSCQFFVQNKKDLIPINPQPTRKGLT